ncbi:MULTISPECIES: monovalent cation/H+ antiporter complex subunit F [Dietzia]|uniref:Monovalent cation/H+ antiporter complex subunit F n=2 Tax=Dietzia TaxID=37914 RepID=A0ABT8GXS3_9ACTN|nr:monovalent cation/H+ antiporter complex subunit F [Dietzia maris]MDN4504990.1 monovalent cation/H+ antiporter complex subunit F [Dietzia maris]
MIAVSIGIVILALSCIIGTYRMLAGPSDADRAIAADLLMFGTVGLIALIGVRLSATYAFDLILIASLVGFLGALSLARALTKGYR